jgi:hypothetical protein
VEGACFKLGPVQIPRIPIWVCGAWSDKRAPRWDGVVAIVGPGENRANLPDEIAAIRTYIKKHRVTNETFDIVVILWSEGGGNSKELEETEKYAKSGATWWLEDLSTERFSSLREVKERLYKGPPGIKSCPG